MLEALFYNPYIYVRIMAKPMNWALDPRQPRKAMQKAAIAKATAASRKSKNTSEE